MYYKLNITFLFILKCFVIFCGKNLKFLINDSTILIEKQLKEQNIYRIQKILSCKPNKTKKTRNFPRFRKNHFLFIFLYLTKGIYKIIIIINQIICWCQWQILTAKAHRLLKDSRRKWYKLPSLTVLNPEERSSKTSAIKRIQMIFQ